MVREGVYLSTRKLVLLKVSWVKGFSVLSFLFLQDQAKWLCSSEACLVWHQENSFGFQSRGCLSPWVSASSSTAWTLISSGWFLFTPRRFHHQILSSLGCFRLNSSPSTSPSNCAPNSFRWVSTIFYACYDLLLIICSADPYENHLKYKYCLLLVLLFWCEDRPTLGREKLLSSLGEETIEREGDCPHKDYTRKFGHPKSRKSWRDDQDERNQWEEADPSQEDSWE